MQWPRVKAKVVVVAATAAGHKVRRRARAGRIVKIEFLRGHREYNIKRDARMLVSASFAAPRVLSSYTLLR